MFPNLWLDKLAKQLGLRRTKTQPGQQPADPKRTILHVEGLEDRTVPAVSALSITAITSPVDSDGGTANHVTVVGGAVVTANFNVTTNSGATTGNFATLAIFDGTGTLVSSKSAQYGASLSSSPMSLSVTLPASPAGTLYSARVTDGNNATSTIANAVSIFAADTTPPSVNSIIRASTNPTNAASVDYTVTFSEPVTGVDAADFSLTTTGISGASVTNVAGTGTTRTVTVNTGSGTGTLRLDVTDNDTIVDGAGNKLGGTGTGNGSFTLGEVYTLDRTAPDTSIDTTPTNPTKNSGVSFTFSGSDSGGSGVASFETSLDGAAFASASSPVSLSSLSDGSHTFRVRAVDAAGNTDTTPASYTFVVDTIAPETQITVNPGALINSNNASFSFTGNDGEGSGVASFEVSLDGATFASASSPVSLSSLSDGSHTFRVRAVDAAGNTDATPASFTFTVDTTAPDTQITVNPGALINSNNASFSFTGNDGEGSGVASFEVSLDGATFASASSPVSLTSLSDGSHTFRVRAVDAAGNTDATPASFTFTVDTTAPSVLGVNSTTANATYGAGATISIQVTFSEVVNVTGTPTLALNSGGTATFSGGSGTDTLTFTYLVAGGQNSPDLDYTGTGALTGGTIQDAATNAAVRTLATPGSEGSLGFAKNIVINTVPASRQFDFQPSSSSPVQEGSIAVLPSTGYTPAQGYGWTKTPWRTTDAGAIASLAGDPLAFQLRDYMSDFGGLSSAGIFRVDFASADPVQITAFLGDASGTLDGIEVAYSTNGTTYTPFTPGGGLNIPAGKFTNVTSPAVTPGLIGETRSLWIRFQDIGGSTSNWSASGLVVRPTSGVGNLQIPDTTKAALPADATTVDTFTVTGATPGALLSVSSSLGTVLTDARPEVLGNQVIAGADGSATFQIRRPFVDGISTITVSDFTGAAIGSATQAYSLPLTRKFDMNAAAPSLPDANWLDVTGGSLYSATTGYGWLTAPSAADMGTYPAGSTTAQQNLYRDYHYGTGTNTFKSYVGAGKTVDVKIYTYTPSLGISGMTVSLEGGAYQGVSGTSTTFRTTVGADGILDITFKAALFSNWATNAIEITQVIA